MLIPTYSHQEINIIEMIENASNLMQLVVKDCKQFMTICCGEFLIIAQAQKKKCTNQLVTIYLDQTVLNAATQEIPQQIRQQNSPYIKLMSNLRP